MFRRPGPPLAQYHDGAKVREDPVGYLLQGRLRKLLHFRCEFFTPSLSTIVGQPLRLQIVHVNWSEHL